MDILVPNIFKVVHPVFAPGQILTCTSNDSLRPNFGALFLVSARPYAAEKLSCRGISVLCIYDVPEHTKLVSSGTFNMYYRLILR